MNASADGNAARTVRIGLTGPIGCGKTTVAGWLADRGAVIVDADTLARLVTAPGEPAHDEILARFGDSVRAPDRTLDRGALARLVFDDSQALRDLEAIVHPAVRPRILADLARAEADRAPGVVVEAIKLVEAGLANFCDEVWVITCRADKQRERIRARGMPADDADRRIAAQGAIVDRLRPETTRLIETSGQPSQVRVAVLAAWDDAVRTHRPSAGVGPT